MPVEQPARTTFRNFVSGARASTRPETGDAVVKKRNDRMATAGLPLGSGPIAVRCAVDSIADLDEQALITHAS